MVRWQTVVGVIIGLGVGAVLSILTGGDRGESPRPPGPILSECDGRLRELVIHYEPSARDLVTPVYRDFLGVLEDVVTVHVVCPNRAAYEDLTATLGRVRCRLRPVVVDHPLTTWARDRWVALAPAVDGGPTTLLSPRGEAGVEIWPARAGDERVGHDLAAALAPAVRAWRSQLYFDGGDFLADGENVLVVPRILPRNLQHTVDTREELLERLGAVLKRRILLLEESPDHHAAMFMAAAGGRTVVVGDPRLAREFVSAAPPGEGEGPADEFLGLPGGPDFTPETQRRFDSVAAQCAAAGYRVVRLPVVPAVDGRTYLTYANVILDQPREHRVVYLPRYRGVERLNAAARAVWENIGCEVRPVDCTSVYRHFGCLHCLVNVLSRTTEQPGPMAARQKSDS